MLDIIVCDRSGMEKLTALEYIQKIRQMGIDVSMPSDEADAQIYPDKIFAPEFLSGVQYLEAVAIKAGIEEKQVREVIMNAVAECGFTGRQLKTPVRVYNIYERKRLQIAQALIEKKKTCIFDFVFDAFDENNVGVALTVLARMAQDTNIIITAKDSAYAHQLNGRVWRMDGE
ncbi:MAG: hypothetical protein ACI4EV_08035 [Lachnospiraceae bacterium]